MPITTCNECGGNISTHADPCPHCGSPAEHALKSWKEENYPSESQVPTKSGWRLYEQKYQTWASRKWPSHPDRGGAIAGLVCAAIFFSALAIFGKMFNKIQWGADVTAWEKADQFSFILSMGPDSQQHGKGQE